MPEARVVEIPHPLAGASAAQIASFATAAVQRMLEAMAGRSQ
jgi:hypothetical protein